MPSLYRINLERNSFASLPRILMTMRMIEVKGVPGKKFLEGYLAACADIQIQSKLTHFTAYDFMMGKKISKISTQTLAELTQIELPALQRVAQKELVNKLRGIETAIQLQSAHKVYLIGGNITEYQSLTFNSLEIVDDPRDADVFVLCKITSLSELNLLSENTDKVLSEREFLRQILQLNPPYLLLPEHKETVKSLAELFQSPEPKNKLIAISAMSAGGVPQDLKTALICLAVSWRKDDRFIQIRQLCERYLTIQELKVAEYFWGFWLNQYSSPAGASKHKLRELCEAANFNYDYFYGYFLDWKKSSKLPF